MRRANLDLVAWEVRVDEHLVAQAWQHATSDGLIRPAGRDRHEQLWRLSAVERSRAAHRPRDGRGGSDLHGCYLGTVQDITERRQAKADRIELLEASARAESANQAKSGFWHARATSCARR